MASQNSASAAMVAIKTEYNDDTDDEAVLSAANKTASCVASMVAVKKEYNAETDDEAAPSAPHKNSVSGVASIVAVKKEIEADTDDEAVATSNAASMVAVKAEYNADTDDEAALSAADNNSASGEVAMAAVKTEYDADTDSDEENRQPIKKAKRDDNEHVKYIAEIRKITDPLLSLGRHDGAKLELVYQINVPIIC